jgi:hypothetical protein
MLAPAASVEDWMLKKKRVAWLVASLLIAAAAACSSSSSSPSGGGDGNGTGTGTGTGTSNGQGTVGASGGKVATSDGTLTVNVPAGALPGDTQITITEIQAPISGSIGKTYDIGPSGTQFAVPVTLSFAYGDFDLMGADPSSLAAATITGGAWVDLDGNAIDTSAKTVSGTTMHLSPYGVHAKANAANKDAGGGTDATVTGDDATTTTDDGSSSGNDATSADTGTDAGAADAPFDATGCTFAASQVGSCQNLPNVCQAGMTFMDCSSLNGAMGGVKGYCCP